ncbi:MAG: hypothetical protein IPL46_09310 [Saprospiraceae bacterium]|nr:hypothetical protein [Saprospiraceae bacterium]
MKIETLPNISVLLFLLAGFSQPSGYTQTISFSPNSGQRGTSFGVTVTGTGVTFVATTTTCVQIFSNPTTLELTGVTVTNSLTLTGTLNIPLGHTVGTYDARVYQGPDCGGTQYNCIDCFTIIHPACLTVINTNSSGAGSLRAAFGCASNLDSVRFDATLNNTTITLNLPVIANDKQLVLYSDFANNITISSVQLIGNVQPFISTTAPLSMSGLKLQGNSPEALILKVDTGGGLDLNDCELNLVTIDKN